jgi:hypothetical protein
MDKATSIIGLDRTTDQHDGGRASDDASGITGECGEAVTLDENDVHLRTPAQQLTKDETSKAGATGGAERHLKLRRGGLADLDATFDFARQDGEIETGGKTFDEANVRAAFDDEEEAPLQCAHLSKIGSNWAMWASRVNSWARW